jgi:hypothetical protein
MQSLLTWKVELLCNFRASSHCSLLQMTWENSGRPHLQNNHSKMDCRCRTSGRVPALEAQTPQLKLQSLQKDPPKKTPKSQH